MKDLDQHPAPRRCASEAIARSDEDARRRARGSLIRVSAALSAAGLLAITGFGAGAATRIRCRPSTVLRDPAGQGAPRPTLCEPSGSTSGASSAASPTIEGPVTGGKGSPFIAATSFDLGTVGYVEEEYFISGTASAYAPVGTLGSDGRWTVKPASSAAYKTRILVFRPADAKRFSGTVVVEWINVSGGLDSAPDWISAHTELIREGVAWVGVSAQFVGVEGGTAILGQAAAGLKTSDPVRYGSLVHPGDSFSYDIFSQAGQAVRHPIGPDPLGGLKLQHLIGIGESQSAFRLVTYVNAVQPLVNVYDAFLVHSRGGGGAALSEAPEPAIAVASPARFRTDLRVPVLVFETETDLLTLGYIPDGQSDGPLFRLWEVAGTAHADTYTLSVGMSDLGNSPDAARVVVTATPIPGFIECAAPVNSGPQHFVLDAAFAALIRWVRDGTPPPYARRLEVVPGSPPSLVRDAHGNAVGGVRTSWVDAPIATLSGVGQTGAGFCFIFGTTVPFDAATLASLYPTHDAYVSQVTASTESALRGRFLVEPDARLIETQAQESDIGG